MPARSRSPHSHGRSEITERRPVVAAAAAELRRLGEWLRAVRSARALTLEQAAEAIGVHPKYLQRLECGRANATVATLVAVALAYRLPLSTFFETSADRKRARVGPEPPVPVPFRVLRSDEVRPFENCLPLYPLRVAASAFGATGDAPSDVAPEAWVVPMGKTQPRTGLFVAQVVGESMNRRIPSGSYCIFRTPVVGGRSGRVVLARHRDIHDPEHGGQYTVKRFASTKKRVGSDSWRHVEVRLLPDTDAPGFEPIVLRGLEEGQLAVVGELVEVLPGSLNRG